MPRLSEKLIQRMRERGLVSVSEAERVSGFDSSTIRAWLTCSPAKVVGLRAGGLWFVSLKSLNRHAGVVTGKVAS